MIRGGLLQAKTRNLNFGFSAAHRLSYASATSNIMSGAKLHTYLPNKKEISKSFLLDQLPPCHVKDFSKLLLMMLSQLANYVVSTLVDGVFPTLVNDMIPTCQSISTAR